MGEPTQSHAARAASEQKADRASDHVANERTFLAWLRTGIAIVVFGFAIGRFAIAIRQWLAMQGKPSPTSGISVWFGTIAILAGTALCVAGLFRYRETRNQLETGKFQPAGSVVDLVAILTALFGLALAIYLVYIEVHL